MEQTKIKLEFIVFGELLNPELFNSQIGVDSTEYWKEGDLIPGNKLSIKRKETAWHYTIDFIETLNMEEVIKKFLEVFIDKVDLIKQYLDKYRIETKLNFIIEIWNEESPSIYFEKKFLHLVNELKADIDIDLYYIDE